MIAAALVTIRRPLFVFALAALAIAALPAGAATDKELRAVRGSSGFERSASTPFVRVVGRITLDDDAFAVTQAASNALVVLPDSSEVALGQSTTVQVGAFNDARSTSPTTLTLRGGTLRFAVRHPAGQQANYRFQTITSQIAVRGTVGLYGTGPNGDVVACLQCDPGDVVVTVGTRTYTLLTGQTLFVSLAGIVSTAATTALATQPFSDAGLTTDAAAKTAFTGASGAGAAPAAASIPAATYPVAGAVFAAGAGAAIAGANNHNATSAAQNLTPLPTPTLTPMPTPTPSTGNGNATLTGGSRKPAGH